MNRWQNHLRMYRVHIGEEKPKNWLDKIRCKIQAIFGFSPSKLLISIGDESAKGFKNTIKE